MSVPVALLVCFALVGCQQPDVAVSNDSSVVAYVGGEPIRRERLRCKSPLDGIQQQVTCLLSGVLYQRVMDRYFARHGIVVDATMIRDEFGDQTAEPGTHDYQLQQDVLSMWHFNRQLWEEYGGRVVAAQFRPAFSQDGFWALLREEEAVGYLHIVNPDLAEAFWARSASLTGRIIHKSGRQAFERPWWREDWQPEFVVGQLPNKPLQLTRLTAASLLRSSRTLGPPRS